MEIFIGVSLFSVNMECQQSQTQGQPSAAQGEEESGGNNFALRPIQTGGNFLRLVASLRIIFPDLSL